MTPPYICIIACLTCDTFTEIYRSVTSWPLNIRLNDLFCCFVHVSADILRFGFFWLACDMCIVYIAQCYINSFSLIRSVVRHGFPEIQNQVVLIFYKAVFVFALLFLLSHFLPSQFCLPFYPIYSLPPLCSSVYLNSLPLQTVPIRYTHEIQL